MVRLVLILGCLLATNLVRAQDPIESFERLARAMEVRNWEEALVASRFVLRSSTDTSELYAAVECMHVWLLEIELRERLSVDPAGMAALSRETRALANVLRELSEDTEPRCMDPARRTALAYLLPRADRAAQLTAEARDSGVVSIELEQVFADERAEIVAQIEPGPEDAWERAETLWREQHTPVARSHEWPARSQAPMIGTGILFVGFGLPSFFSTLTALSGRGLPSLSAGGWGITFALLPALVAAWTWEEPKQSLLFTSMVLTAVAVGGGVAAVARLDRDGRFFGRGLLIGSAVSVLWQIGGWLHHRYPERSRREWRERVRVAPAAGRGFGGLSAQGRF